MTWVEYHVKCLGPDIPVRQHSKNVSIELPATSRHPCDLTERLLKATLSPIKQTNKQNGLVEEKYKVKCKKCEYLW